MGFLIVTARSLIWMLLSLLCALMMLSALLSPVWITAATQNAMVDNETVTYTPSLGVYARCGRPIGRNHPICTLMSAKGLGADSEVYPTVWKAATVFLIMGLFVMGMTVCTGLLSCCVQSVFKKSIFTLSGAAQCVAGICFILGVMLHPMAWGVERAHKLCGKESSPFYLGDCSIGTGLFVAVGTTILTFVCACLSVPAETSTSSDKVQDKIYEGQTLICLA
ncbi:LHFPL tetraspan subfamily member 2 protein [Dendroctonus ponderosae]